MYPPIKFCILNRTTFDTFSFKYEKSNLKPSTCQPLYGKAQDGAFGLARVKVRERDFKIVVMTSNAPQ